VNARVPPEIIFDETLGQLFVAREAGNVVDPVTLGSIEYAVEHFHVDTLLILGHESCGAVKATLDGGAAPPHIDAVVERIAPAAEEAKKAGLDPKATLSLAVKLNVLRQIDETVAQSKVLREFVHENKLRIAGGIYNLRSGRVEFLRSEHK
jgi:carbonic anhydrase